MPTLQELAEEYYVRREAESRDALWVALQEEALRAATNLIRWRYCDLWEVPGDVANDVASDATSATFRVVERDGVPNNVEAYIREAARNGVLTTVRKRLADRTKLERLKIEMQENEREAICGFPSNPEPDTSGEPVPEEECLEAMFAALDEYERGGKPQQARGSALKAYLDPEQAAAFLPDGGGQGPHGLTWKEIALRHGVTVEQIYRRRDRAIAHLCERFAGTACQVWVTRFVQALWKRDCPDAVRALEMHQKGRGPAREKAKERARKNDKGNDEE